MHASSKPSAAETTAFTLTESFGVENVRPQTRPSAALKANDVRIKMRANSLNFRDLLMIEGQYNPRQPLPLVPLSDGVGVVTELGPDVRGLSVGERVVGLFAQDYPSSPMTKQTLKSTLGGPLDGMLQSEVTLDAAGVHAVPAHLSDEQAACLPCAALTAYSALFAFAPITATSTVLTLGTGGVSLSALLFAKAVGAKVIVTSGSDAKRARAEALGADFTINYNDDARWGKTAKAWAGGDGVDAVIEVGGAGTLAQSVAAVKPDGLVALIGVLSGGNPSAALVSALMHQVRVQGVFVGHRESFGAMCELMTTHALCPEVGDVFDVADIQDALALMKRGGHFGKIVLKWPN